MENSLIIIAGVFFITIFVIGAILLGLRESHANIRYQNYRNELKKQGKYQEWENQNKFWLVSRQITQLGIPLTSVLLVISIYLGYDQISGPLFILAFLLVITNPIATWQLRNKVPKDWK